MSETETDVMPITATDTAGEGTDPANMKPEVQEALTLMTEVCEAIGGGIYPEITSLKGDYLTVDLAGGDTAETWGKAGRSLDALQFLCNLLLARRIQSHLRLSLDADNYRERRTEALTEKAREIAQLVKDGDEEAVMEALPAHERRIVHSALMGDEEIETYSEGEEPNRRIVIAPKRNR